MEKDPLLRSTVVCVLLLDGSPDWDRLPERLERSTRQTPGFRHRVVMPPLRLATPRWVIDPDFDLSWHVRRFEAAPPKTLATVLEFARKTGMAASIATGRCGSSRSSRDSMAARQHSW
jgi:hypothetical protein